MQTDFDQHTPAAENPLLSVRNLTTVFNTRAGTFDAVNEVSFDLARGEVLGVVGESGSGKSVTGLSLIGLVDHPGRIAAGEVLFGGNDLTKLGSRALRGLRGNRIAMIFQDPMMTLNPTLRIETQMVEALKAHRTISNRDARARAIEALRKVGIPSAESRISSFPHQFSGGMRQRVAIAIALLNEPDLIIADEPTTALDVTIQAQILHEVKKVCLEQGTALIWITHDLSVVAELADRVAVMYAGRFVELGATDDVLDHPQHPYTRGLLDSVPAASHAARLREIGGSAPSPLSLPEGCPFRGRCFKAAPECAVMPPMRATPQGSEVRCHFPMGTAQRPARAESAEAPARGPAPHPPILDLAGVGKTFSTHVDLVMRVARALGVKVREEAVRAVDNVSLSVGKGEVVGLVGESGCGKSTLARLAAGIMPPDDGTLSFKGRATGPEGAGLKVQMVFQDPLSALNPRHRVKHIVGEAVRVHKVVGREERDEYLDRLLELVGLSLEYKRRLPHQFSGGQRQRLVIARALAVKPDVLICDEAVSALDVSIQAQILNLLMDLRDELDLSILFISHDLGVVRHISDRIFVMYLGRIVEEAPAEELFAAPNHPYTQTLMAGMPSLTRRRVDYPAPSGELPSPLDPPPGCHFHPRCPFAFDRCRVEAPLLNSIGPGHKSACHRNETAGETALPPTSEAHAN